MFERLLESGTGQRRGGVQMVVSIAVHGGLVLLAVRATAIAAAPSEPAVEPDTIIWTTDAAPIAPMSPPPALGERSVLPPAPDAGRTLPVPALDAAGIPPVDAALVVGERHNIDLERLTGGSPRGGHDSSTGTGSSRAFAAAQLDRTVELIDQPLPVYPPALRDAGMVGHVDLEFVVDRDGRVEPASVVVRSATHAAFAESARTAILAARFQPALLRGQAVRQLVRQRVRFDTTTATEPTSS